MPVTGSVPVLTINRVGFLGGVERVIVTCATGTRTHGFRPVVVCPAPGDLSDELQRNGIEVVPGRIDRTKGTLSPARWLRLAARLRAGSEQIAQLARQEGVALLHAHHPVGALYALSAARTLRIPLVLHVHETLPLRPLYALLARRVIPHCALFICVSDASRALMRRLGAPEDRIRLIYNSVDERFLTMPGPVAELQQPGPHIGIFGVLEPRKGQADFIRAAALLKDRHPTARFWVVGPVSFAENASYAEGLQRLVSQSGLAQRVHFTGYRSNIPEWMAGMDAVVLASQGHESLPTVLIEASALGRPVAATDVGGVREIIDHDRTGLVVPPMQVQALASAIDRLLGPEGAAFGQRAAIDARRRFAPARFADDINAAYRALLSGKPARINQAA